VVHRLRFGAAQRTERVRRQTPAREAVGRPAPITQGKPSVKLVLEGGKRAPDLSGPGHDRASKEERTVRRSRRENAVRRPLPGERVLTSSGRGVLDQRPQPKVLDHGINRKLPGDVAKSPG
jgi:hypothetical protein